MRQECKHGQLKRSCDLCHYEDTIATLVTENTAMRKVVVSCERDLARLTAEGKAKDWANKALEEAVKEKATELTDARHRLGLAEACIEAARAYGRVTRSGWVKHGELNAAIADYDAARASLPAKPSGDGDG